MNRSLIAVLLAIVIGSSLADAGESAIQPVFMPNGWIVCGSKSIWPKSGYGQLNVCIDNDAIGSITEMFGFGKGDLQVVFFQNSSESIEGKTARYAAEPRDSTSSDVKLGTYTMDLSLRDDGWVQIKAACVLDDPKVQTNRYAVFDLPSYLKFSGVYEKGDKRIAFDENAPAVFSKDDLKDATLRFFPDAPARSFVMRPVACSEMRIAGNRISMRASEENVLELLLDLRAETSGSSAAERSPNGIDHWSVDRLRLPDYAASANLVQNPSFEAGLRYWVFPIYTHSIIPLKYADAYALDDTQARSGGHSMRINAYSVRHPSPLGPFSLPLNPGEEYTYSFYAKGSKSTGLSVNAWGRGQVSQVFPENVKKFEVTDQWQRFSIPFTAQERFATIFLDAQSSDGSEDGVVWVDDVQIQPGELTDFVQPPIAAQLLSAERGNFLKHGQNPEFKLQIHSEPGAAGTAEIAVEDFFFNTILEKTYSFTTDDKGSATIALDDLSALVLEKQLRGVCVAAGTFTLDGVERPYKDYFRFSVMNLLENKHKNKNLFNLTYVYSHQAGGPHYQRSLERERAIGFGSICYDFIKFANDLDYALDEERVKLAESYGFEFMGRPVVKLHDGVDGEISEQNGAVVMQGIKNRINPTDAELAEFEKICELKAKSRPWNKIWWFTGESNPGIHPLEAHPDAFAKFLLATARGIKRGNPDAKVLVEGGPWTMEPQYGGKWTERYIQDTRRLDSSVKFDGAAAHHYRNFPETPDLDSDIAAFLEMLDRNGCSDWPFYVNEGGNYAPFNIPQEGMSPYIVHSSNAWYIGPLSYDYGKAERITAAFSARNWIIGLKYADRVACMQDFNTPNRTTDYDFTPRAFEKIPNTLGRLLGDASFYRDIRFAPRARCYVFKDDKTGAPIAAIWGHKESVDRWKESPPEYTFDFGQQQLKFVDLMENETSFESGDDGRTIIPMSPFPIFIVGQIGAEEQLCAALASARPADGTSDQTVIVSAYPDVDGKATVEFRNTVEKPFAGDADVTINDSTVKLPLSVGPLASVQKSVEMPAASESNGISPFHFKATLPDGSVQQVDGIYLRLKPAAPSEIELGDGVVGHLLVDQGNLELMLEARDESRAAADVFTGVGVYVDPFGATNDWMLAKAARQDLAVYELVKSDDGKLGAMCHFVQGTQAGSGSYLRAGEVQKRIVISTEYLDDARRRVTLRIPQEVLAPLKLEAGARFGMNVSMSMSGKVLSLAPIRDYTSAADPGQVERVWVLVAATKVQFNGGFEGAAAGFWEQVGSPAGWSSTMPSRTYTAATGFIQVNHGVTVSADTGMTVNADARYALSADLGGDASGVAQVRLLATQHADGSGKVRELVQISRKGNVSGYELTPTTATSKPAPRALQGYHLRVELTSSQTGRGDYDNIVITPQPASSFDELE